jgi:hypothetical protein
MLTVRTPSTGSYFIATCDKCRRSQLIVQAPTFEDASRQLKQLRWFSRAIKGRGVKGWDWWCPTCSPENKP